MANPQLSNGYVRIANELLEAICQLDVSGSEMRILLYIIRRTYGFNKDYAEIPLSEIKTEDDFLLYMIDHRYDKEAQHETVCKEIERLMADCKKLLNVKSNDAETSFYLV